MSKDPVNTSKTPCSVENMGKYQGLLLLGELFDYGDTTIEEFIIIKHQDTHYNLHIHATPYC